MRPHSTKLLIRSVWISSGTPDDVHAPVWVGKSRVVESLGLTFDFGAGVELLGFGTFEMVVGSLFHLGFF